MLFVFLVLLAAQMCAQGTGAVVPPQQTEEADSNRWSFAAAGYGYIIPDDQSYFSPTFRAAANGLISKRATTMKIERLVHCGLATT